MDVIVSNWKSGILVSKGSDYLSHILITDILYTHSTLRTVHVKKNITQSVSEKSRENPLSYLNTLRKHLILIQPPAVLLTDTTVPVLDKQVVRKDEDLVR